jgi:hypothetical protein
MRLVQEYMFLTGFQGDEFEHILRVLDFDNGTRPSGARVPPHVYTEFVKGKTLLQWVSDWSKVRGYASLITFVMSGETIRGRPKAMHPVVEQDHSNDHSNDGYEFVTMLLFSDAESTQAHDAGGSGNCEDSSTGYGGGAWKARGTPRPEAGEYHDNAR